MRHIHILALVLSLILPAFPAAAQSGRMESIAVIVNDDAVTASDVNARIKLILTSAGMPNSSDVREKLEPQIVNTLIDERLILQEAGRLGINPAPQDIEAGFSTIAQQNNMTADQFRGILRREGIDIRTLEDQIRAQVAWSAVIQEKLRPQIEITDNEVDAMLGRLGASVGKTRYLVSEIFLPVETPRDESNVRQLADKLTRQLLDGRVPFQRVAQQFSQAAGASRGGDLGWVQEGQLPQELEAVLARMNEGDLSQPIRSLSGFHILHLRKKGAQTAEDLPARDEVLRRIGMERLDRMQRRYLLDLKSAAFIERRGV